ncbi:MAG: DUF3368 domain-containing protein [Myxococcales bacterium]|nr:DUF3368 domain-containing protein [Myxococcales bacterium]
MSLLIGDANIFIDFEEGGLLLELFALPETIAVPDLLFEAELRANHEDLLERGLQLLELDAAAVRRTVALVATHRRASNLDLAALALAEQRGCPLLTGDRHLRKAGRTERVEVRGSIWLAQRLLDEGLVDAERMRQAFDAMQQAGRRLPWDEVERLLQRYEQGR